MKEICPFVFFGTPEFAVIILDELKAAGLVPALIVTTPDKPKGRGLVLTPPPVKVWANEHTIPVLQPAKLDDKFCRELSASAPPRRDGSVVSCELYIVAAYGKIIPQKIIDLPKHGALNVHPSLLPKYRGPSPVETQIIHDDRDVGVTIMQIDEKMDHGPIIKSEKVKVKDEEWPPKASELNDTLWHAGGKLLAKTIPGWVAGTIIPRPQEHDKATYCKLITKEDAEIDLDGNPYQNFLKIRAYDRNPRAYFLFRRPTSKTAMRVKITDAEYRDGRLIINRVIPEGKREMDYTTFTRNKFTEGNT